MLHQMYMRVCVKMSMEREGKKKGFRVVKHKPATYCLYNGRNSPRGANNAGTDAASGDELEGAVCRRMLKVFAGKFSVLEKGNKRCQDIRRGLVDVL
jgi:hypothetical protein